MNCGMRYDELVKIRIDHLKCTKYGIEFTIKGRCKNSVSFRQYVLRRWPSDRFSQCILMDPLFAMSSWILQRGDSEGYVFCNIVGTNTHRLSHHEPWYRKPFVYLCRIDSSESLWAEQTLDLTPAIVLKGAAFSFCAFWA